MGVQQGVLSMLQPCRVSEHNSKCYLIEHGWNASFVVTWTRRWATQWLVQQLDNASSACFGPRPLERMDWHSSCATTVTQEALLSMLTGLR